MLREFFLAICHCEESAGGRGNLNQILLGTFYLAAYFDYSEIHYRLLRNLCFLAMTFPYKNKKPPFQEALIALHFTLYALRSTYP